MAHEVETMVSSSGIVPWHNLGVVVDQINSIEEAITLAGLDWGVEMQPLFFQNEGELMPVDEAQAVVRATDKAILGVVGPRYTPLQNKDKFNFFQDYLDAGEASLETAGSLQNGRKTWILAKLNRNNSVIVKGDEIEKFLLLSDSYDGTMAVRVGYTPIRVVCKNTMSMAHSNIASQFIRVRHNKNVKANLDTIQEIVNIADASFEATAEQYRFLASKGCNTKDLGKYIKKVFDLEDKQKKGLSTRTTNIIEQLFLCYECGAGQDLPGVKGTWWQTYNMVTDYLTHEFGSNEERRLNNLWFGTNVKLNKKAFDTAMEFASAA
jgi:phage/plasmid-like protein (TIGR03299 family)